MTFETKSSCCRVSQLGFKRRATAVLKSNLIRSIAFGTAVARRLKPTKAEEGLPTSDFRLPTST